MSKPWLETWKLTGRDDDSGPIYKGHGVSRGTWVQAIFTTEKIAALCAAAPDMCRALLAVEWIDYDEHCPFCRAERGVSAVPGRRPVVHESCWVDVALTKAGLPDQASRDAARKELGL